VIGSTFAAASGVLFAPLLPLNPLQLTLLVVSAFGAAAIGAFRSLPLTFLGGLLIGVLASVLTRYLTTGLLAGVPSSLPFLVLFALLLVYPNRRRLPAVSERTAQANSVWKPPATFSLSLGAVVLIALVLAPQFTGLHLMDWASALAAAILFLSLSLLVRTSGQISMCQVGFAAIGAAAFSHLAAGLGVPWLLALLISGLIAVPISALLAIPAIRLSGLYLALATFGFGILLQYMFYQESYMFGANGADLAEPLPHVPFFSSDTGFYYLVLACTLVAAGALVAIDRTRLGRLLRGIADAPATLQTSGAAINVTRVLVFCLSGFLAAVAGALAATIQSPASPDNYPPLLSLTYLAVIIVIAPGAPWNALIAGFATILIPAYIHSSTVSYVLQAVFGGSLILLALTPEPMRHLPERVTRVIDRAFPRWHRRAGASPSLAHSAPTGPQRAGASLELSGIRVQFGGLTAVNDVSLTAPAGTITGLIGPNGAGKTTTFNVCSGLVRANAGRVLLDGRNIMHSSPAARARLGIGRTFQRLELFDSLSVRDNVALGAEASFANANPLRHLLAGRGQARVCQESTAAAIELCGLGDVNDVQVSTLSTGRRRLVDLARCLAARPRLLLLDEPSSGLDAVETREFAGIIRRVVDESGVGVLIVEHDLSLVLDICSSIYVLDFGEMLFSGTPDEVMASPAVQSAYLGEPSPDLAADQLATESAGGAS
jgi:ABC-type branched-subunit amino acid transport system ATPase component/ABC-type branched-subunit amino acid transport system permease subunit